MIPFENAEMSERNGAHGVERWATTVLEFLASSFAIAKSRKLRGPFLFLRARSIEKTTSAAVSGLPSENLTPGRSLNVNVFLSGLTVYPAASHGTSLPAGEVMKSGSKILS